MLEIKDLTYAYNDNEVIKNFNLSINNDEIVALIGKSGCGKSTIINCCATILDTNNKIFLNDKYIDAKENKIGLVMQDLGLLTWLNVRDNCLLPYKVKKINIDHSIEDKLNFIATKLNINSLLDQQVTKLSGGQQQRVALSRLFTFNPDYILLDEAFSSLDLLNKDEAIKLFMNIWNENKVPTLMVTHSIDEALYMASKIVILKDKGNINEVISNPLFQDAEYKQHQEYGNLYYKIEGLIKGEDYEK